MAVTDGVPLTALNRRKEVVELEDDDAAGRERVDQSLDGESRPGEVREEI